MSRIVRYSARSSCRRAACRHRHLSLHRHRGVDAAPQAARWRALRRGARRSPRILRDAFAEHGGHEIDTQGDSFFVAFRRAKDAVSRGHRVPAPARRARLARRHRAPRAHGHSHGRAGGGRRAICRARREPGRAHLQRPVTAARCSSRRRRASCSVTTRSRTSTLRDLGEHQLKDMDGPERLYQVVAPGLRGDFPALKTAAPPPPSRAARASSPRRPPRRWRSRWRRPGRRVLIAATFAAALVGATVGVLATQGGGSTARRR